MIKTRKCWWIMSNVLYEWKLCCDWGGVSKRLACIFIYIYIYIMMSFYLSLMFRTLYALSITLVSFSFFKLLKKMLFLPGINEVFIHLFITPKTMKKTTGLIPICYCEKLLNVAESQGYRQQNSAEDSHTKVVIISFSYKSLWTKAAWLKPD